MNDIVFRGVSCRHPDKIVLTAKKKITEGIYLPKMSFLNTITFSVLPTN